MQKTLDNPSYSTKTDPTRKSSEVIQRKKVEGSHKTQSTRVEADTKTKASRRVTDPLKQGISHNPPSTLTSRTVEKKFDETPNLTDVIPNKPIRKFQEVTEAIPTSSSQKNQSIKVETSINVAQKKDDSHAAATWHKQGVDFAQLGQYENALLCFEMSRRLAPEISSTWSNKGGILASLNRHEEALECFDTSIQLNHQNPYPWDNKGVALLSLGRYEESITCFKKALKLGSENPGETWYNKGTAYVKLSNHKKALQCFESSTQLNPKNSKAWNNKKKTHITLGQDGKAFECKQVINYLTTLHNARRNIAKDQSKKSDILTSIFKEASLLTNRHPAKKIAFEFLHTQVPDNKDAFETLGRVLEIQAPKAAKKLYKQGLLNNNLLPIAARRIESIMTKEENKEIKSLTSLAWQVVLGNVNLFDDKKITQIQTTLKNHKNPLYQHMKKFVEGEAKERNTFPKD